MGYDVIVIGGGPAGLTAALYSARAQLKTLLLEQLVIGGQMAYTSTIENYPGFPEGILGPQLVQKMRDQAVKFGAEIMQDGAKDLIFNEGVKKVITEEGELEAKAIILAPGTKHRRLNVPGEGKFMGRGVSVCATCDGAFYKDKHVAVVGGGDAAVEEGLFLTRYAAKVTIIHRRDQLRASKIFQDRAFANPKINFIWNTVIESINGTNKIESLTLKNVLTNEKTIFDVDGLFVFIGQIPNTDFCPQCIARDENGFILTDENYQTSVKGVFAAGDARKKPFQQIAIAVGEGAFAAMSAIRYLESKK